jgi:uncharacterized protein (TIGR02594 family)
MKKVYDIATGHLGLREIPGPKAHPIIAEMFAKSGHPEVKSDEISWCAAFVGACLRDAGMIGTGSLAARSYLKWGEPVEPKDAEPGDIVVFWRESPSAWQGHVGFYDGETDKMIRVLGGNQSNAVTRAQYSKDRLLGIRRKPDAVKVPIDLPVAVEELVGPKHGGIWAAVAAFFAKLIWRKA